jgi:hypothetical protein
VIVELDDGPMSTDLLDQVGLLIVRTRLKPARMPPIGWCCWMGPEPTLLPDPCCGVWALRRFQQPCACTGGPSLRTAWRMFMGWLVWNWGERWGASGMGRTDRCDALRNPNGVVRSDLLVGIAAADGIYGNRALHSGTVGAALGQLLGSKLRQRREQRFGAVPLLCG